MAKTIGGLEVFAKAVVGSQPWLRDPKALPIPWRAVERKQKLKIGVMWNDGMVTPTPPVQRALKETVGKLKQAGHEIVDWEPREHAEAYDLLGKFFVADGGESVRAILDPVAEPFRPEMEAYATAKQLGTHGLWQLQLQRTSLQKRYLDQWNEAGIDAILCPTTPFSSVVNGNFKHVAYTGVYNILDYSAISFPTGIKADKELDKKSSSFTALSEDDEQVNQEYDADAVHDMPVSLQLVARRLEEEKVIDMTKTILEAL